MWNTALIHQLLPLRCAPGFFWWIFGFNPFNRRSWEAFWVKEQLGLAPLTEVILMFYWFFDLFFSAPASKYTFSLYLLHEEPPNRQNNCPTFTPTPYTGFGPDPCLHRALPEQGCRTRVQNKGANDDSWRCLIMTHLLFYPHFQNEDEQTQPLSSLLSTILQKFEQERKENNTIKFKTVSKRR